MNKKIDDALDMESIDGIYKEKTEVAKVDEVTAPVEKNEKERDLDYARQNIYKLIEGGDRALEELGEVAGQSQQPRAYEVISSLIKTMLDANKELIEISEKKNPDPVKSEQSTVNNNHLYIGSTADLLKFVNKKESDDGDS